MNASSRMFCLVDEGNDEVIALQLLQRHLHFVALYWHPTISLSIGFQLKRSTRPIEECSSLPTACICKLSFPDSFRFGNISYWKQSLFAWCLSITRRPISCGWISAPSLGRCLSVPSGLRWFVARCGDHEPDAACRADGECRAQDSTRSSLAATTVGRSCMDRITGRAGGHTRHASMPSRLSALGIPKACSGPHQDAAGGGGARHQAVIGR